MKRVLFAFLGLALCASCHAVGVTSTTGTVKAAVQSDRGIDLVSLTWISNATGDVSATLTGVTGVLLAAVYAPSSASAPTDLYDVTITTGDSIDVLRGTGANLSATTATIKSCDITSGQYSPIPVIGSLTLTVSNAGDRKSGTVRLILVGG